VEMVRAEIAVRVGDVKHEAIETGVPVARSGISIGEMEPPKAGAHGIVPPEGNKDTRTKVESHVHTASVVNRDILGEAKQTTIDVEEGLPTPRVARGKLQANRATAGVGILAAIGTISVIKCERLEIQIAANEQVRRSEEARREANAREEQVLTAEF
jgi:hypothetical protein